MCITMKISILVLLLVATVIGEVEEWTKTISLQIATDVFKRVSQENFLFSPLSLQSAISLALVGADRGTARELSIVSHVPSDFMTLKLINTYVLDYLEQSNIKVLNTIYVNGVPLNETYIEEVSEFGASVQVIRDFNQINEWIMFFTGKLIPSLRNKIDLTIANAIYFEAEWEIQFLKTKKLFCSFRHCNSTDMLLTSGEFYYFFDKALNCEFVKLPLVGNKISLVIALPKKLLGVYALNREIVSVLNAQITSKRTVYVHIPENFAMPSNIPFKRILQSLGAEKPFSYNANFRKLSDTPVKIDDIVQQASIQIDSRHAYLTSATVNMVKKKTRSLPAVEFIATHPFIYYFTHEKLGLLFAGRYGKP